MNFITLPQLGQKLGDSKKTKIYQRVADGLLPKPIKFGGTNTWPDSEIEAIQRALLAGAGDDQLRALVRDLEAARKQPVAA